MTPVPNPQDLDDLIEACQRWLDAWILWPTRLVEVEALARRQLVSPTARDRAVRVLDLLATAHGLTPTQVIRFSPGLESLENEEHCQPDWRNQGSLYSGLHQLKNLTMSLAGKDVAELSASLRDGAHRALAPVLQRVRTAWDGDDVEERRAAVSALRSAVAVPPGPANPSPAEVWRIIAVEDMPEWRRLIEDAVVSTQRSRPEVRLEFEAHTDCEAALLALRRSVRPPGARARRASQPRQAPIRRLLILDLGLPGAVGEDPGYTCGLDLLRQTSTEFSLATVVLTTPHDFLDDHLEAHRLGVADYLLKGPEAAAMLRTVLLRLTSERPARTLSLSDDGSRTIRVDGIELRLDPVPFAVLQAIGRRNGRPVTGRDIEDTLRDDGLECRNIPQTVYAIRHEIKEALRVEGELIRPEEELIETVKRGDEAAYQLVARMMECQEGDSGSAARRILLVEDEETWRRPVAALLARYGYEVAEAANRDEAIRVGATFQPGLCCLDLCIPDRAGEEARPGAGIDALEDLREDLPHLRAVVLSSLADNDHLREQLSLLGIRPDDIVRKQAWCAEIAAELALKTHRLEQEIKRGVRLPLPQLGELPYLRLRVRRPAGSHGRDELIGVDVFGQAWVPAENDGNLLLALCRNPGRAVPQNELLDALLPGWEDVADLDESNQLKQAIKRLRNKIATQWLHRPTPEGRALALQILANDAKAAFILNARVDWIEEAGATQ